MILEVSCARGLLLKAETYGYMSLVDFFLGVSLICVAL
jgi:hypothetical protein